jgi:hypothetical protein
MTTTVVKPSNKPRLSPKRTDMPPTVCSIERRRSCVLSDPVDKVVRDVLAALEQRDWELLNCILHPYVRWSEDTRTIRGRTKVLAYLAEHPAVSPSAWYELRDGQIYRWRTGSLDGTDPDDA